MIMSVKNEKNEHFEEIFLEASGLPVAERADFLSRACGDDLQLRAEIEELLSADAEDDSLLDAPIEIAETAHFGTEREGTVVGPYKLLQQIGEGGFCVVYMAQQIRPVRRKVALKIIKPGMDSKEVVARFEAERQALAMMEHPNIAKVLDVGTTDSGRPYFAMELVKGVSLTEYCDQNHLDTRQRLTLFSQVCKAIQHAHLKSVIHRDIKPSNVMVTLHDGQPVPKVIDFGVAKALGQNLTERTLFTRYGQVVGTPQYMSPEQAEMSGLDVDIRSDIYSLGVLLYELLTGDTPLDAESLRSAGYDAMRKMICESDPPTPSSKLRTLDNARASCIATQRATVAHALPRIVSGDLDWIVMKALEKDRNRRYESASALAADIERYLSDEPVEAGPPTFLYQLSKLYRRNRAAMTTIGAIGAALLIGISLTTWAWTREINQRQAAVVAQQKADDARKKAQANAREANELKVLAQREAARSKAAVDLLQSLLSQAAPNLEEGPNVKLVDFLTEFSQAMEERQFSDKEIEIDVRVALAHALRNFSLNDESNQHLRRAEELARQIHPPGSLELATALSEIAVGYKREEQLLKEVLAIFDEHGERTTFTVTTLTRLGNITSPRPDVCAIYRRRACESYDGLSEPQKAAVDVLPDRMLADWFLYQEEFDQALELGNKAIRLSAGKSLGERIEALLLVEEIHHSQGQREAAKTLWDKARAIARASNDPELKVRIWKYQLDRVFREPFDLERTRSLALQCENEFSQDWRAIHRVGPGHTLGYLHGALLSVNETNAAAKVSAVGKSLTPWKQELFLKDTAQWLRMHGNIADSIKYYDAARAVHPRSIWNRIQCGRAHAAVRDFEQELRCLEEAKQLVKNSTEAWDSIAVDWSAALALKQLGRMDEAKDQFALVARELPNHSKGLWGPDATAAILVWCIEESLQPDSTVDESEGSVFDQAYKHLQRSTQRAPSWPDVPIIRTYEHAALGMVAERRGNNDEAIRRFVLASENRPGTFAPIYAEWITDHMVDLLVKAKRLDKCEAVLRQDIVRRDAHVSDIHPERAFVRLRLIKFLLDHNRKLDGAKEMLDEAAKVFEYHAGVLPNKEKKVLEELRRRVDQA